ncbi:ATP-binding cassette sub-family G member 1-like [Uranotaenia lowii]|uniref:ATP-binding cassette sub-family G member 1-like n=1 Tax=Uranotaenia lowii TaxID=190385 RepID=UPI0024793635|nr:ATP-binding cassette sub-family G member 1-like [Uranotaenia lowii]
MELLEISSVARSSEFAYTFENIVLRRQRRIQARPGASSLLSFVNRRVPDESVKPDPESEQLILKGISGKFRSGRLTAILGPSGSGKSSLLNVLSGFRKAEGTIKLNSDELSGSKLRKAVSYTEQEVSLWLNLTVEESLKYAIEFQLPPAIANSSKKILIQELIETLGLERCRNTLGKNLSGGEYKRLAMAIDLLASPQVMLLDEPTTGLDVVATNQVVVQMRNLAQEGRIVACVIHQPSSGILRMFDDVFLITRGNCLYNGPLDQLIPRFSEFGLECPLSHSPADFALEMASSESNDRIKQMIESQRTLATVKDNIFNKITVNNTGDHERLSTWSQFALLTKRNFLCTWRDTTQIKVKTAINIMVGLLIGTVYYDMGGNAAKIISNTSIFHIILHNILFTTIGPAAVVFPLESAAFIREYRSNSYGLFSYFLSKIIVEIPLLLTNITILVSVIYILTAQPLELSRALGFWSISVLFGWISEMWGLIFGCFFKVQTTAFVAGIFSVPVMLFSGCFLTISQVPLVLQSLTYLSFERYAFEGYLHVIYGMGREDLDCPEIFCYFKKLSKYLKAIEMPVIGLQYDFLGLIVWVSVMTGLFYFSLKRRVSMMNK